MRWSEKDYEEFNRKRGQTACHSLSDYPPFKLPANEAGAFALGRLPVGSMNKTEAAYDTHLWNLRHAGKIAWHKFEGIKLRLADNTFLTIDFPVLTDAMMLEMREVKGFMRDDAAVKLKVAASIYPFRFILVRKKGAGWEETEI
jgi:hypothetical protein